MAICVAGDFNPDEMIRIVEKYFGGMKPNPNLPKLPTSVEQPITEPVVAEVLGLEAENIQLGWRTGKWNSPDKDMLDIIGMILRNGQAGLIDLNLLQAQKVLSAYSSAYTLTDHSALMMGGTPKEGQTLEEVRDLLLGEIEKLKKGEFSDDLLSASINNMKLNEMNRIESNSGRGYWFVNSFINGTEWENEVGKIDRIAKITKKQIMDFANEKFGNNYAIVYKRKGKDPTELKIDKPQITPIATNRDASSEFVKEIQNSKVVPIEPVFLDYSKDMKILKANSDVPVLYKQNVTNGVFSLIYVFDMGNNHDKALGTAFSYLSYLGTSNKTPAQIKQEFYNLACSFNVSSGPERVYVMMDGLAENMDKALALFEELLADPQVNEEAFTNLRADILKRRADAKLNQGVNFNRLNEYAVWGADSPGKNILSENELNTMNPLALTNRIKNLSSFQHRIIYYGPDTEEKLLATLNSLHKVPSNLNPVPTTDRFKMVETTDSKVLLAEYDAKQIYMGMVSNYDKLYSQAIEPTLELYNEYFGGGMNAIVFQEMREARGLAYSAGAFISQPSKMVYPYTMRTFIATQNDKMDDALQAFHLILRDMPLSENAFKLAKEGLITRLRTERITKENILWNYIDAQDLGLNTDARKNVFEKVANMTLADIKAFQEEWVKNRKYTYFILGKEADLDLKALEKYGPIQKISQEELFGY